MFIINAIILGILIGYILGGRLSNLAQVKLRWSFLVLASFLVQIVLFSNIPVLQPIVYKLTIPLHLATYICILMFTAVNIKIHGVWALGLGIFFNALVIFLNGGHMPSTLNTFNLNSSLNNNIEKISKNTLLPWLGDIFSLPSWLPFSSVFSLGDMIIAAGVFVYLIFNMRSEKSVAFPTNSANNY